MENRKHYAAAIAAFVIWGFFSIPLRALKGFYPGEILYFRILTSFFILAAIIFFLRRQHIKKDFTYLQSFQKNKRLRIIALTLAGGALLSVNWLTFIHIVNHINIKTASFSYLICPVITAVLGYVIIKERLTSLQWLSVALCAVSCALMGLSSFVELGYSFLTAFTYALYLITQRKNQGFDRMIILGVQILFSLVILSFCYPLLIHAVPSDPKFYIIIFVIAAFFTVLPLFLNLFALNKINSATIGVLMYLNPLVNFSVAFFVFKETISALQALGYTIIVIALVLFNLQNIKKLQTSLR
ncbi:EamA family transporter [Chryseosolibacter indicus]|uniref:EamA family transporter n=1 Tax=Chryseosolibacter indicus TaxID=2782351 RepID=A0ABS5VJW4_9BACT|nr:EamA family transporter [Chryseosolibacter indicus]MBT1701730.1 EamA family transporter [Chryseosolibacter indicus]